LKWSLTRTLRSRNWPARERELKNALELQTRNAILAELRKQCSNITLPESMVQQEAAALAQQATERARQMGLANMDPLPADEFREQAIERLMNALIIGDIARKEKVQVDYTRVREKVNEIAETFENPAQIVELYYNNPDLMSGVENTIMESQVIELIAVGRNSRPVRVLPIAAEFLQPGTNARAFIEFMRTTA